MLTTPKSGSRCSSSAIFSPIRRPSRSYMATAISFRHRRRAGAGCGPGKKNKQLLHQSGGLDDSGADLIRVPTAAIARVETREQQIAIKHDAGQQVVEIMHTSAGQSTDGFPSLSLQ